LNEEGPSCNCGGYACFERYVGNRTLMRNAAKLFHNTSVRLQDVFARARRGDRRAIRFWQDAATHIGNALAGVINLLNPRMIIIGGGVANNFRFMGPTIRKVIRQRAMKVQKKMVRVARAKLGDDAGILGAHILVKEAILGR
jgi:predicted NBD/HSP70 family sugar kinase